MSSGKNLRLQSQCYAIDTPRKAGEYLGVERENVSEQAKGDNNAYNANVSTPLHTTLDSALPQFADASIDLLHIDDPRSYEDVKHDFERLRPKLSERAVVLFHGSRFPERHAGAPKLWSELRASFAAFEFLHGQGLGVLAYGRSLPRAVAEFFAATRNANQADEVRSVYARLGTALQVERAQAALTYRVSNLEAKSRELAAHIANCTRTLAKRGSSKPDEDICDALVAGLQFCARQGFSLDGQAVQPDLVSAVAELAVAVPSATINRESPDASIIVPIHGQLPMTLNCLNSLVRHETRYSIELIIADDASPDASETKRLDEIPWVRYIRWRENGGFIATCNEAAAAARGRFLVFLNNDTRVARDWLDEMIGSFAIYPKAGLVGSKLFNADGNLQEAGGILWRNGKALNYGRNSDPNDPRYCFARRADYCSGASIAVPTAVWAEAGGFDTEYAPAYCEDADLAFRLRQLGYEVWFQPLSRVIHYEGKSHGRDETSGVKAYQVTNMKRLGERWRSVLDTHGSDVHQPDQEANRFAKRRMLVVDACTPAPDQDSGSYITRQMIEAMQQLGWQITFLPRNYKYQSKYTRDLQRIGVECLYEPFVRSIGQAIDLHPDIDVVLGYRVGVLDPIYDELRRRLPTARIILHTVDLRYLREEREAELLNNDTKRIRAAQRRQQELSLIAKVDCTIVHTPVEKALIEERLPISNILVFPYIAKVRRSAVALDVRRDIMFLGGYLHRPNVDAVEFFLSEVWPLLVRELPTDVRFLVVGANPPARLSSLASDRILVTGQVSELGPYFDKSRVFVAPLRYGSGIKGKIVQSMANGVPSVVSSIGAEGMMLTSGEQAIIADLTEAIRQAVMDLFENRGLWLAMQASGYEFVEKHYSWEQCLELCQKSIEIGDQTWLARERSRKGRLKNFDGELTDSDSKRATPKP